MLDSKNKIGDIRDSNIEKIIQTNIEKQETTNNQINIVIDGDFTKVAISHELFPDYAVATKKMSNGKYALVSKPLTKNAVKKYPPNFKSSFKIIDERYKNVKNQAMLMDMLQYADSPVEVKITRFEQYLGDVLDPYPNPEISPMQAGTKTYIMPQKRKLPKAEFKVNIEFDNSDFKLSDIDLKLTRQLSNNKFILDNCAQESAIVFIQLQLEYINDEKLKCNLNYKANPEKIKDSRCISIFNEFVLNLLTKKYSIYDEKRKTVIMSGKINNKHDEKKIIELEDYINLIKAIIEIEEYFNTKFVIPNEITKDDIYAIIGLYKKIYESKNKIELINVKFPVLKKNINIERLQQLIELKETSFVNIYNDVVYNILDKEIRIKQIKEKFDLIKCSNVEEVKEFIKSYDLLEDNYELKIEMTSAEGKTFYKYTEILKDGMNS